MQNPFTAVETDGRQILSIRGDEQDPFSRGHICPKATALKDMHEDPDRLRHPLRRIRAANGESQWVEISWEEALDRALSIVVSEADIDTTLRKIRGKGGIRKVFR